MPRRIYVLAQEKRTGNYPEIEKWKSKSNLFTAKTGKREK